MQSQQSGEGRFGLFGVEQIAQVQRERFVLRVAAKLGEVLVHLQYLVVQPGVDDADRSLLEGDIVFLGAFAQRELGPHSFGRSQLDLLALELACLAKQIDEHCDLGFDHIRIDRLDQIIDRPH